MGTFAGQGGQGNLGKLRGISEVQGSSWGAREAQGIVGGTGRHREAQGNCRHAGCMPLDPPKEIKASEVVIPPGRLTSIPENKKGPLKTCDS